MFIMRQGERTDINEKRWVSHQVRIESSSESEKLGESKGWST